ncbi:MAG: hypothetical protein ACYTKC_15105 [Planctomycetota bacterium]|jgi:hypothetical protein
MNGLRSWMVLVVLMGTGCALPRSVLDPTAGEVPLPAAAGWYGRLVYESDVGIWTVRSVDVIERLGCPEVIGLDDKGRCTVLVSYSGKWTPYQTTEDGAWLGALAHGDVDPNTPGRELYTGGKNGNLYQIVPHQHGGFDVRLVTHIPGEELHTCVCDDLLPDRAGRELLVFTGLGRVYDLRPGGAGERFTPRAVAQLPGRVRDAVVLPAPGQRPWIATVSRAGQVALLRLTADGGFERKVLLQEPMGFGRIAHRPATAGEPEVLYVSRDDGVILRLGERQDRSFAREIVYAGPQGPRGVIAGRFDADPDRETVVVFGYSKKVQLLTRQTDGSWQARTIFTDRDKGHWLAACEVDGRNATDEILGSGYGGRIFLLGRPPGYGLGKVAADGATAPGGKQR